MNLLRDASIEITGRDIPGLERARHLLPVATRVNVTYLGAEDPAERLAACVAAKAMGFLPVSHIAARRMGSEHELRDMLGALRADGCLDEVFLVGGDPSTPLGPFTEALDILRTGLLTDYGVRRVGIAGYPDGHPNIATPELDAALEKKVHELAGEGLEGSITTQFSFDAGSVLRWIEAVRHRGFDLPVRIGLPGPAGVRRLLSFARRVGVSSGAGIVKKYGFSLTNLLDTAGPDQFVAELSERYNANRHGDLTLHFYTFGGLDSTATWLDRYQLQTGG